jgi:hypothetical protein
MSIVVTATCRRRSVFSFSTNLGHPLRSAMLGRRRKLLQAARPSGSHGELEKIEASTPFLARPAVARPVANVIGIHSSLRSSGTSPNFRITFASPNSPVAGSPPRQKASAPTCPGFPEYTSARITAAFALRHCIGFPGAMPSSEPQRAGRHNRSLWRRCFGYVIDRSSLRAIPLFVPGGRSFVPVRARRRAARKWPSRPAVVLS